MHTSEPSIAGQRRAEPLDPGDRYRVLVLAPLGRTDAVLVRTLARAGISATACTNVGDLCQQIRRGAGVVVVLYEAVGSDADMRSLLATLDAQPPWSSLPVKLIVDARQSRDDYFGLPERLYNHPCIAVLERPMSPASLVSVVKAALRDRERQYELRDALHQLETINAQLEERVAEQTADVRTLADELTEAEQKERDRLARVLHDHLQQMLYSVQMHLHLMKGSVPPDQAEQVDTVSGVAQEAIDLTRNLAVRLSPPALKSDGFISALHWLADRMEERQGLRVAIEHGDPVDLPDRLSTLLFESVRELLFNVVKHAGVDQARVATGQDGAMYKVRVIDEGKGFDEHDRAARPAGGFGLSSIVRRIELIGGHAAIDARPDEGTTITLAVPVPSASE